MQIVAEFRRRHQLLLLAGDMSILFTLFQLAVVFVLSFAAGVWLVAQILPDGQGPPGWLVLSVLVALSALTAYPVVVQGPVSDCVEYTPQGSGRC